MSLSVSRVRSRGYLATYLTSDLIVRPVPPVFFVGRDHARILVKVGDVIFDSVSVRSLRSKGFLATYLTLYTCIPIYVYAYMYVCFLYMCVHVYAFTCKCMHVHVRVRVFGRGSNSPLTLRLTV